MLTSSSAPMERNPPQILDQAIEPPGVHPADQMLTMEIGDTRDGLAGWCSRTIGLRYSLSYVKLFEARFRAIEDPRPFDPDRPHVREPRPPAIEVPPGHDVIVARHELIEENIPVLQKLPKLLRYAPRQLMHYYTDLQGGPEQAFRGMSSKTRSSLTRKVRNYKSFCGGEIRWQVYRSPDELTTYFDLVRDLSNKTYQQRLFDSGLQDTAEFRSQAMDLAGRDAVRAFLLFHGEKPVAYLYTPAPDGFLVYDYLGYDPEYARHSPGTVLQYLALEMLYAEGRFPLYYWGYGYSQTKKIFSTAEVLGADVFYFRPTLRNRAAVRLHYAVDRFSEYAGAALDRLKVKQWIRQWLRK